MLFQQLQKHRISQKFVSNKDTVITHPQEGDDVVIFNWGQYIKRMAKPVNQKWKFNNSKVNPMIKQKQSLQWILP